MTPVSIGIRFHDMTHIKLLKRSLWSLAGQSNVKIHLILACQGFSADDILSLNNLCERVMSVPQFTYQIQNIENPNNRDLRSTLLNSIIECHFKNSDAKFLQFLDFDDLLFSHAAETLVAAHELGNFGLTYGDIHCADVYCESGSFYVKKIRDVFKISKKSKPALFADNFLPLHSYMFNTSIISRQDFVYDADLSVLEDYDLLLRLATKYAFSPVASDTLIGLYNFYSTPKDPINTTANIFADNAPAVNPAWTKAYAKIITKIGGQPIQNFVGEETSFRL